MTAPNVSGKKQDGNTGVVAQALTGILAIIAPSASGVANVAATYTRQADVITDRGMGPLVEDAAYYFDTAGKPVLVITPTTSTAATNSAVNASGATGTSVVTVTGTALDEYDVVFKVPTGGTIGVAGIVVQYSFDNGATYGGLVALGTATSLLLNLPRPSGTSSGLTLHFAAGTFVTGDVFTLSTTHADMTNSDLLTALEALRITKLPWDNVYIDTIATATTIATVDSWLSGLEAVGIFKMAWMNIRHKIKPVPTGETEAAYATAAAAVVAAVSTIRVDVAADGGYVSSLVTGCLLFRQAALGIATRSNPNPLGRDPAFVEDGPIPGFFLADANGNPLWHNEYLYPGLDALRLSTLTTFPGKNGTYIGNANMLSAPGSDYVFDQHAKTSNVACSYAYAGLTNNLSRGVRKQPPDPVTKMIYILESDAEAIEQTIQPQMANALKGQVQDTAIIIARNDDLSSNAGATVHADVEVESLAYIKAFAYVSKFVRTINVQA
jgi:hypothetical protein